MNKNLRTGRPIRKNKRQSVKGQCRSQIIGARPIGDRPADAEDRSFAGHLEGDLVIGGTLSQIATLVDRKTRYLTVVQLADRRTETVVEALIDRYVSCESQHVASAFRISIWRRIRYGSSSSVTSAAWAT